MNSIEYAFVHIPKNAGESFKEALKDNNKVKYFYHDVLYNSVKDFKKLYVIRNPIDRFTASFFYLKNYPKTLIDNFFDTPNQLLSAMLDLDVRSIQYVKIHTTDHTIYGKPIPMDWVFSKQTDWVKDPYKILIYENLKSDIDKMNSLIGTDIVLPHKNKSKKLPFEYSSDHLELLNLIYKKDIQFYNKIISEKVLTF